MKRSRAIAAAIVLALALTTAAPAAASAYPPQPPATSCPQSGAGSVISVGPFGQETCGLQFGPIDNIASIINAINGMELRYIFLAFERVTFTLGGMRLGPFGLASVRPGAVDNVSIAKVADASGVVSVRITLPADASGTYVLSAVGDVTGAVPDLVFTIPAAATGETLPATGQDGGALSGVWLGGGTLLLGGVLMTLFTLRRRRTV